MTVQAEMSFYPLAESDLLPATKDFLGALTEQGLNRQTGAMSTIIGGDSATVFSAIAKAFEQVAADHRCVLVVKYSNACSPAKMETTDQD